MSEISEKEKTRCHKGVSPWKTMVCLEKEKGIAGHTLKAKVKQKKEKK